MGQIFDGLCLSTTVPDYEESVFQALKMELVVTYSDLTETKGHYISCK